MNRSMGIFYPILKTITYFIIMSMVVFAPKFKFTFI
jgi:hypothetical protein